MKIKKLEITGFKSFYEKLFSMFKDEIAYKPILAIVNNKKDNKIGIYNNNKKQYYT